MDDTLRAPLRLKPNPVWRMYQGGALLSRFRDGVAALDGDHPEDWVGSATPAANPPGRGHAGEGLSVLVTRDREVLLRDLLEASPREVAGSTVVGRFGTTTGVLVKLLDAGSRLPVHAHPTRAFAREHLGSPFGKAEAWLIVATRTIEGAEPPCIRLGFREGFSRDAFLDAIARQDTGTLLAAMNRVPVEPGAVIFVPPGVAHSTGAGVLLIEVQEPTDFSILLEWTGFPLTAADADLGLPWDVLVETLEHGVMPEEQLASCLARPRVISSEPAGVVEDAYGDQARQFFRVRRLRANGALAWPLRDCYSIGIVTEGKGKVVNAFGSLPVSRGSCVALLAAAPPTDVEGSLEMIVLGPTGEAG